MEDSSKNICVIVLEDLGEEVTQEILIEFFKTKKVVIKEVSFTNSTQGSSRQARLTYDPQISDLSSIVDVDGNEIPKTKSKVKFGVSDKLNSLTSSNIKSKGLYLEKNEEIKYKYDYPNHIHTKFTKKAGDDFFIFTDQEAIDKQRGVLSYFLKEAGSTLLSGNSLMNVSLPINIFDHRTLLEVWAHQQILAPHFLEAAGKEENSLEKLKLTTSYAISQVHLSVTQMKPFNPIWGETFQAKIGNTHMYLEQSSHHPPRYHYYYTGENFKAYGFQDPQASTGANSVTAKSSGMNIIEYPDGTKHRVIGPTLSITGTSIGQRTFNIIDKLYVMDYDNDYIAVCEFNPDKRNAFSKMFSKKTSFPDCISGEITRLSQCTYDNKNSSYSVHKNHFSFVKFEGEWTRYLAFDNIMYWENNESYPHFKVERMTYTMPSDSTFRDDVIVFKEGNEEEGQKQKSRLEEIQRNDRTLRKKHAK